MRFDYAEFNDAAAGTPQARDDRLTPIFCKRAVEAGY